MVCVPEPLNHAVARQRIPGYESPPTTPVGWSCFLDPASVARARIARCRRSVRANGCWSATFDAYLTEAAGYVSGYGRWPVSCRRYRPDKSPGRGHPSEASARPGFAVVRALAPLRPRFLDAAEARCQAPDVGRPNDARKPLPAPSMTACSSSIGRSSSIIPCPSPKIPAI